MILFMKTRSSWIGEHLLGYAKKIGLDLARFKADIEKDSVTGKVEDDFESGVRSGVNGTPSFFINGEKYEGGWDADDLIEYLKNRLNDYTSYAVKTKIFI